MGKINFDNQTEPISPASGNTSLYVDSADRHLKQKDEFGNVIDLTARGGLSWLESAKDFYDPTPNLPVGPSLNDRYIASATANGWTENYVYEWNGTIWVETITTDGDAIIITDPDPNEAYIFDGSNWVAFGAVNPGGSDTQVQYNDGGGLGGDSTFTFNKTTKEIGADTIDLSTTPTTTSHKEGKLFYDNVNKCLAYFNENSEVTLCIGREFVYRVYNDSGAQIDNGKAVYINGANSGTPTVELLDCTEFDKSRIIGIATADISNGAFGYVTYLGDVNDIDTSAWTEGTVLYAHPTTPGDLTDVEPTGGNFRVRVGVVSIQNATTGRVTVFTDASEYTSEINAQFGFPNRTDTTLSFVNGTRTFSISPTATEFYYYHNGDKYITTGDSVVIPDISDLYAIYYDGSTLTAVGNLNAGVVDVLIRTQTMTALVYWNSTNQEYYYLGDERHGFDMSGETHSRFHFVDGAQYLNGLPLTDIITNASGDVDAHAQFGVGSGAMVDENVPHFQNSDITSTTGLPIFYLSGPEATPELVRTTNAGFSVLKGTNRLFYNSVVGGNYQLVEVASNNDFVLCHVFMWNDFRDGEKVVAFIGQAEYTSRGAAEAAAEVEIDSLVTNGNLSPETIWLGTVIFQTGTGKSNAVAASIEETDDGSDYVDGRTKKIFGGGGTSPPVTTFNDELFEIFNDTDTTKKLMFEVGAITTATTRTVDIQDQDGTMALLSDIEPTLKAGGLWQEGTSLKNYVYRENEWLGYPTVDTTDHLEPQPIGSPENSVDTVDFPTASNVSVVKMVHKFTVTEDLFAQALQVYAPGWDLDTVSRVTVENNTTGEIEIYTNPILDPNNFVTLSAYSQIFRTGASVDITLELYNTTAANAIDGGWVSDQGTGAPASTEFTIDSFTTPSVMEISHTDLDLTSRATELDGVVAGSIIRITETASVDRTIEFEVATVDTAAPSSTKYTIVASSINLGPKNIRDNRVCTIDINVPVSQPTEYGVRSAYYPTNNPSWATITTELYYDGVLQAGSTDAYGINVIGQKASISNDWFYMAVSGQGGGSGGASTFDELTDTPANKIGSNGLFATVNADEDAIVYSNGELEIFSDDFESGNFTAGGWTTVNDGTNDWIVGSADAISGTYSAYISDDGTNNTYNINTAQVSHVYVPVDIPSNATGINVAFSWESNGELTFDYGTVWMTDTTFTPVAGTEPTAGPTVRQIGETRYEGQSTTQSANFNISAADLAAVVGTTQRFIFTWKNDTNTGSQPPFNIDNVVITACFISGGGGASTITSASRAERATSNVTVSSGVESAAIVFNSEEYDEGGDYSTSTGQFTAPSAGIYQVNTSLDCTLSAAGKAEARIYQNTTLKAKGGSRSNQAETFAPACSVNLKLSSSDTVEVRAFQNSGFNMTVNAGNGTQFSVVKIGDV